MSLGTSLPQALLELSRHHMAELPERDRRDFEDVRVEHLLMPSEVGCWLFRHAACARLMVLWSARVPGGRFA